MKIAILTYHSVYNFGANLQAFATCMNLKKLGHEVELLNYWPKELENYYSKVPDEQAQAHLKFVKKHLPITDQLRNERDLKGYVLAGNFNLIIVGSDAVLGLGREVGNEYRKAFFLNWLYNSSESKNIKSAYLSASNMGAIYLRLSKMDKLLLKNTLANADFFSVRDYWSQWMLKTISLFNRINIEQAFDPVFTLKEMLDLSTIDVSKYNLPDKYIVVSFVRYALQFVNQKMIDALHSDAIAKGYKIIELPVSEGPCGLNFERTIDFPIGPLEWYKIIAQSSGFVGNRFHPVVVALSNNVPFVSIDMYSLRNKKKFRHLPIPFLKYSSKTFDICNKACMKKYVIPAYKIKTLSGVLDKLLENRSTVVFANNAADLHRKTLNRIINMRKR
ncbi:MAG: polysaccharide pyruvyl transferase family protein [Anaerohalosphaeraceae bacterium]|nr:polysaccharide pyruvyl transferase family protein [Anaerohalosphaeraceae bacterium]